MKVQAGTRVVITGAGSGIGAATARRCARAGAHVVAADIDGATAEATARECGSGASSYECDVSDRRAVAELAERVETEHGPVDVLVNNAGVGVAGRFLDATLDDWDWLRGVNLDGVAYGCHVFGSRMVARRHGHVVNLASMAGYLPSTALPAYCATKAAVIALSQCLRADWRAHGVGVSAICPGVINTPIPTHTRMVGAAADNAERAARVFRYGHSPDLVAKAIVSAIEKDREFVPVGFESHLMYGLTRLTPRSLQGLIARAQSL